ncbi:MAG: hypothetical protein JJE49_04935 [Peptostreptococcaceae bacterium]|nr:hypothetical protein [Peptostreptococcaceae bacterium]
MITIWNQREVFIGNPSEELKSTMDTLTEHKIKYKYKVFSDSSVHFLNTTIASLGIFLSKDDSSKIYYLYVHKKDYANALAVLEKGCYQ